MEDNEKDLQEQQTEEQKPEEQVPVITEETTEVETPKGRAALRARYATRHPETNWDEADDDALADQAMSDYDDMQGKLSEHEENDKKLSELFKNNRQSAAFLMGMANGDDFLTNLQRNFGSDIVEAMQDPDKLEDLKKANQEYLDKVAENNKIEEQWEENMPQTLDRLQTMQDEMGMSDEDVADCMGTLEKVVQEYLMGNISDETLSMFMKGKAHDKDVAAARHEGEVNGRNANIEEKIRKRSGETDGMPNIGGQSNNARGLRMTREGAGENNTGQGIWAAGGFKRNQY